MVLPGGGPRGAHRPELGGLLVGDLHTELVLGLDGDLDHRQRVDVEVVDERLLGSDVTGVDTGDLLDDLGEAGQDLGVVSHWVLLLVGNCGRSVGRRS